MKKIINKLFEWLGYVPKEEYERLLQESNAREVSSYVTKMNALYKDIGRRRVEYRFQNNFGCNHFSVAVRTREDFGVLIKTFPYHDADSAAYARICAEELCDMLNEKY